MGSLSESWILIDVILSYPAPNLATNFTRTESMNGGIFNGNLTDFASTFGLNTLLRSNPLLYIQFTALFPYFVAHFSVFFVPYTLQKPSTY